MNKILTQRIKELRILSGISQEELAERTQLSLRTIQRIENGETHPRGDSLRRLAAALGTTAEQLQEVAQSGDSPGLTGGHHPDPQKEDSGYLILLNLSAFAFLAGWGLGVIAPLVLWLLRKESITDVDRRGKEILNFQLTWWLLTSLVWVVYMYQRSSHVEPFTSVMGMVYFRAVTYTLNGCYIVVNAVRTARHLRT